MLRELRVASTTPAELVSFLEENFQKLYDYFTNGKHAELLRDRFQIDQYIQLGIPLFRKLDLSNGRVLSFLTLLLSISERFEFRSSFQVLSHLLKERAFDYGCRLRAAELYLVSVNTSEDLVNRFDKIVDLLQSAYDNEEDSEAKVLTTLVNYYGQVVSNFPFRKDASFRIRQKIVERRLIAPNSFLHHPLVTRIVSIDTDDSEYAFSEIHSNLDSYLGRSIIRIFSKEPLLTEDHTVYSGRLSRVASSFDAVKSLNVELYDPIRNDSVFASLHRGVRVLDDELQLYAYMYSYGNMHYAKLKSAFDLLPNDLLSQPIRIVDWACGQGMATMVFIDYVNSKGLSHDIRHITLVEPSEIALKRASLHCQKFVGGNNITTINKDFDSLVHEDFINSEAAIKIHFFSNILDIDLYSLDALVRKIDRSFGGENYFVCVSPFINDLKANRVRSFMSHFSKCKKFRLFGSIENRSKTWIGNWSRIVHVFQAQI